MKNKNRKEIFEKSRISILGKLSLFLSFRNVISELKKGNWLDVLSGYNSELQQTQLNNKAIKSFVCLDHKLDHNLSKNGFLLKECSIDKTLPFKDNEFDNVTIINGLEHLWNPEEILKDCFRITNKKGVLQIIVPTWFGKPFLEFLAFKLHGKQELIEMDDHKMYYDEKTLWPMLVKAGFKPRNIKLKRIKFFCSLYLKAIK